MLVGRRAQEVEKLVNFFEETKTNASWLRVIMCRMVEPDTSKIFLALLLCLFCFLMLALKFLL